MFGCAGFSGYEGFGDLTMLGEKCLLVEHVHQTSRWAAKRWFPVYDPINPIGGLPLLIDEAILENAAAD